MTIDIGYEFKDARLLTRALTHSSAVGGHGEHNETLEFFGDSIMDAYTASRLMALMPEARENVLAQRRSQVTCDAAMTALALKAGINQALIVGRSISQPSPRMLADAMEAVLGAAFIDGGFAALKAIDSHLGMVAR
jgi:ribonuclease-3